MRVEAEVERRDIIIWMRCLVPLEQTTMRDRQGNSAATPVTATGARQAESGTSMTGMIMPRMMMANVDSPLGRDRLEAEMGSRVPSAETRGGGGGGGGGSQEEPSPEKNEVESSENIEVRRTELSWDRHRLVNYSSPKKEERADREKETEQICLGPSPKKEVSPESVVEKESPLGLQSEVVWLFRRPRSPSPPRKGWTTSEQRMEDGGSSLLCKPSQRPTLGPEQMTMGRPTQFGSCVNRWVRAETCVMQEPYDELNNKGIRWFQEEDGPRQASRGPTCVSQSWVLAGQLRAEIGPHEVLVLGCAIWQKKKKDIVALTTIVGPSLLDGVGPDPTEEMKAAGVILGPTDQLSKQSLRVKWAEQGIGPSRVFSFQGAYGLGPKGELEPKLCCLVESILYYVDLEGKKGRFMGLDDGLQEEEL
ncbi:unnamed protein product [Linum trigynum]|uniref:Uncharacterized protein n=1 Tax=Linum trigynum TaxID=586398 RepID=A0AAV2F1S9_9ROSI